MSSYHPSPYLNSIIGVVDWFSNPLTQCLLLICLLFQELEDCQQNTWCITKLIIGNKSIWSFSDRVNIKYYCTDQNGNMSIAVPSGMWAHRKGCRGQNQHLTVTLKNAEKITFKWMNELNIFGILNEERNGGRKNISCSHFENAT